VTGEKWSVRSSGRSPTWFFAISAAVAAAQVVVDSNKCEQLGRALAPSSTCRSVPFSINIAIDRSIVDRSKATSKPDVTVPLYNIIHVWGASDHNGTMTLSLGR
jgi:hypothetical protein